MTTVYLLLITVSGLLHAFYNFLMRRQKGSRIFLTGMFIAGAIFSVVVTFVAGVPVEIAWQAVPNVFFAALFYTLYQVFISKGFEKGDIALVYPLAMLSPLFIPVLALIFLDEIIPFYVWIGIFITIGGVFLIQINSLTFHELKKMIRLSKDYRTARIALLASFMYAFGSVLDKSKIGEFHILIYLNLLLIFMALQLILWSALFERKAIVGYSGKNISLILAAGAVLMLSFTTFRVALQHVFVSIAVPLRLSSIVFAVMFGVLLLKEKLSRNRILGILILLAGLILIQFYRGR